MELTEQTYTFLIMEMWIHACNTIKTIQELTASNEFIN